MISQDKKGVTKNISFREIKPTKANLINLQKKKNFANRGKRFLEFKRELLMFQIRKHYNDYLKFRENFITLFKEAMAKLHQTYKEMGKNQLNLISKISKIQYKPHININFTKDIGIIFSRINYQLIQEEQLPAYSFEHTSHYLDDLILILKQFFESIILLAEKEDLMLNFAFNFKNINRRINALEHIIIPDLNFEINKIKKILEENERESFVLLKTAKKMIYK